LPIEIIYVPKLFILPIFPSLAHSSLNHPSVITWIEWLIKDDPYRPIRKVDELENLYQEKTVATQSNGHLPLGA